MYGQTDREGRGAREQYPAGDTSMTISAISSASTNPYLPDQNSARQSFSQLVSALQSGNLSAAQGAYSSLTQNAAGQIDPNSPIGQALNQIGQDLQSGDINAAQQTLNSLQQNEAHRGHHHHHHGGAQAQTTSSTPSDPTTLAAALTSSSSTNAIDVTV
jgi:hypothetical protein